MGEFDDKVAIVTGSGGGIGQAYAEALAREGAAVVVADINTEGGQAVAERINADGGTALHVPVDVSDPASAKAMADRTLAAYRQDLTGFARWLATQDCSLPAATRAHILAYLGERGAAGIAARKAAGNAAPLNIVACENAVRATSQLKNAVYALYML